MTKKNVWISLTLLAFALAVTWIDAVIHMNYFLKITIKILLFFGLPMLFFLFHPAERKDFKSLFAFRRGGFLQALLLGVSVYAVILGGYFLLRGVIDFSNVTSNLTESMGITADNFLFVSLYISLMNSFAEEFFFRGYGFITLKRHSSRAFAYLFSSAVFAVYHVGMLVGMFHLGALALLLFGLVIGGCIFNYLNERHGCIYPSWFVHMFANFAINTVGFLLFGAQ